MSVEVVLGGCTAMPLGSYLKTLGVLRIVSEQADVNAFGWWQDSTFRIRSGLTAEGLLDFLLNRYQPTPIVAPWNGGSGFYEKDNKEGIDAIANSSDQRFAEYRHVIGVIRSLAEVAAGKSSREDEEERRTAILIKCRNLLPDRAVEWFDAAVGISAEGRRAFAPVVGTGGNEGRLDYTNNFMTRLAALLITPKRKTPVKALLTQALFGGHTEGLLAVAAGQFDPGRAGGANQGQGVAQDAIVNPWDFVLTMEGAVAWASGIYRRQGVSYRSTLCSPFTVGASTVGYGSSSKDDDARGEIWTPIWERPTSYRELRTLLREGRADVSGVPAKTGLQFAEAVGGLGTDRGISQFVRYSLLKRRGDSYVALPAGMFTNKYRSTTDQVRCIEAALETMMVPKTYSDLRRAVESAMYDALLHDKTERIRAAMAALGRLIRRLTTTAEGFRWPKLGDAAGMLQACGAEESREVRIAASIASIRDQPRGSIQRNLDVGQKEFAWFGRDLPARMVSVLERRLRSAAGNYLKESGQPRACELDAGDATLFLEGSVDDDLIEDLIFGFACLQWAGVSRMYGEGTEVMPLYALLKHMFLADEVVVNGERKRIWADTRVIRLLQSNRIEDAAEIAKHRLRLAGLVPADVAYFGGVNGDRLAAALVIPVRRGTAFGAAALNNREQILSV